MKRSGSGFWFRRKQFEFWDLGYGFELKTSKVTGILVILGSILITVLIYSNRGILV